MRTCGRRVAMMLVVAGIAAMHAGMRAPEDATPLLWDRARVFPVVIVGTLQEGFENGVTPQRGTNAVLMKVEVSKVIKGKVEGKSYSVSAHEQLPKLLAARDAVSGKTRKYLLVMSEAGPGVGFMGKAHVDGDLERIYPWSQELEDVVTAFIKAADATPAGQIKLCQEQMKAWNPKGPSGGVWAVQELLARAVKLADEKQWKALGNAQVKELVAGSVKAITTGAAVGEGAKALATIQQRDSKSVEAGAADGVRAALRKWLGELADKVGDRWPTEVQQGQVAAAVELLGQWKDKDAKEVLVKVGKSEKWIAVRKQVGAALVEIFGEEGRGLVPSLPVPRGIMMN